MGGQNKEQNIFKYIFKYAGVYKNKYIASIIYAFIGVIFSLIPYILMGKIVRNLVEGNKDISLYLQMSLLIAACWILRILFHNFSTNISHKTTFKLLGISERHFVTSFQDFLLEQSLRRLREL